MNGAVLQKGGQGRGHVAPSWVQEGIDRLHRREKWVCSHSFTRPTWLLNLASYFPVLRPISLNGQVFLRGGGAVNLSGGRKVASGSVIYIRTSDVY